MIDSCFSIGDCNMSHLNDAVTINLGNSPTGIYTFSISTGTQVATKKIIMQ